MDEVIFAPELRYRSERFATTETGIQIGVAHVRKPDPWAAEALYGPYLSRRMEELFWRLAKWGGIFLAGAVAGAYITAVVI